MAPSNEPPADPALLGEWVRERLRKAAPTAVRAVIELAENADSEQVRLQAAKDLLGLVGVTQKQQVEVDHGVKRGKEEVDHELEQALKKLEAGRVQPALPVGSNEKEVVVAVVGDEIVVEAEDSY